MGEVISVNIVKVGAATDPWATPFWRLCRWLLCP